MTLYSPGGLNLADTTAPLILAYDDSGTKDVVFAVSASGDLTITPDGGDVTVTGTLAVSGTVTASGQILANGTIAAGTYSIQITAAVGAARDIFAAGQAGVSNGFLVQSTGAAMVYTFTGGQLIATGTLAVTGTSTLTGNVGIGAAASTQTLIVTTPQGANKTMALFGVTGFSNGLIIDYVHASTSITYEFSDPGSASAVIIGPDLKLAATKKFYLDGGGNTYIHESSGDVLDLVVGAATTLRLTGAAAAVTGDLSITGITTRANSGGYYWSAQGTATVGTAGVFVKVSTGTSTTSTRAENFTISTNNRATYTAASTQTFRVSYVITVTSSANNEITAWAIAKNGTVVAATTIHRKVGTGTDEGAVTVEGFIELAQNDYVELFGTNNDNIANVAVEHGTCTITEA
jgi:hypothetical protein